MRQASSPPPPPHIHCNNLNTYPQVYKPRLTSYLPTHLPTYIYTTVTVGQWTLFHVPGWIHVPGWYRINRFK